MGEIVVKVTPTKTQSMNITNANIQTNVSAKNDASVYYSQVAKDWATKTDGLVQNEDYSSKYYSQVAKDWAQNAENDAQSASTYLNQLDANYTRYDEELTTFKNTTIGELDTLKTNALDEISTTEQTALLTINNTKTEANQDIDNNRVNTLASITNLSNSYIDDINATGKSYNNLTYRNITNCITEIPQRINYTLDNGTLTVKAGSVVIVPYGTEDLSNTYPVGSTFLNDNFKVVDTQYALNTVDNINKFFVWVENQTDLILPAIDAQNSCFVVLTLATGELIAFYSNRATSGPGNNTVGLRYNTTENIVNFGEGQFSFPFMEIKYNTDKVLTNVETVFNGFGYIGSTLWIDKGIKALGADGYNEDGQLRNQEFSTYKFNLYTLPADSNLSNVNFVFDNLNNVSIGKFIKVDYLPNSYKNSTWLLNTQDNFVYEWNGSKYAKKEQLLINFGNCNVVNNQIQNAKFRKAFVAADAQDYLKKTDALQVTYNAATQTLIIGAV